MFFLFYILDKVTLCWTCLNLTWSILCVFFTEWNSCKYYISLKTLLWFNRRLVLTSWEGSIHFLFLINKNMFSWKYYSWFSLLTSVYVFYTWGTIWIKRRKDMRKKNPQFTEVVFSDSIKKKRDVEYSLWASWWTNFLQLTGRNIFILIHFFKDLEKC